MLGAKPTLEINSMHDRFRSKRIVSGGGDDEHSAIKAALKQSNSRLTGARSGSSVPRPMETKENNGRRPSAAERLSEAEELVQQIEQLVATAGFDTDPDFLFMCESVRSMDQVGTFSPKHVASFHTLVREALTARNTVDRVKQLQKVQGWVSSIRINVKVKAKADAKASKAQRKEAVKRRAMQREALRQRNEKQEMEELEAQRRQNQSQKKEELRNYEHIEKKSQVADWKQNKQHKKKLEEDEQAKVHNELQRQRRVQKKLLKQRQAAEAAQLEAEVQADRAMRAASEVQRAQQRSVTSQAKQNKSMEDEIARRVTAEVERQLKVAMAGALAKVETDMYDMSIKAGNFHKQVAAQENQPNLEVEVVSDDEFEEEGDWGDSDDEGLEATMGNALAQEVRERLCIAAEESDDEDAGMHQYDEYGAQQWPSDVIEERLQKERALLGINIPDEVQDSVDDVVGNTAQRPESPMSARFWEQPQHDSDAAVGDRVQAAVARARRMAELAHGRRSVEHESAAEPRSTTPTQPIVASHLRGPNGMQMLSSEI